MLRAHSDQLFGSDSGVIAAASGVAIEYDAKSMVIKLIDLASGSLTTIASLNQTASGVGWASIDLPWVVWEQGDSPYNGSDFSVHSWNQKTGGVSQLFTSRLGNDAFTYGFMPFPLVHHGYGFWAQPLPRTTQAPRAELRRVNLITGAVTVLDTGSISSPVLAGTTLIWGRSASPANYSFKAVNVDTLQPAAVLPEDMQNYSSTIGYLAASSEYVVWSGIGVGNQEIYVWKVGTDKYSRNTLDSNHILQFMQLAGHFLLWYTGTRSVVLDLETGDGFDIRGSLAGSSDDIVWSSGAQAFWVHTASAPAIHECNSPAARQPTDKPWLLPPN